MKNPWTNVYGLARTLAAMGTLLTLLSNSPRALFYPATRSVLDSPSRLLHLTLFSVTGHHFWLAHILAIGGLLLVVSGWRPRFTGVLHWWITWSFSLICIPADGGDQVAHVLTLLMLPITLTDPRRWHWGPAPEITSLRVTVFSRVALSAIIVVRFQGAAIYFSSAVAKFAVNEWTNGTALFYWLLDPRIGLAAKYHDFILAVMQPSLTAAFLSWFPIGLELALSFTLAMSSKNLLRKPLFVLGLLFHSGNIVFFGLVSFFFSMTAILVMMTRPVEEPFSFPWLIAWYERVREQVRSRRAEKADPVATV